MLHLLGEHSTIYFRKKKKKILLFPTAKWYKVDSIILLESMLYSAALTHSWGVIEF